MGENSLVEPATGTHYTNNFPCKAVMGILCSYDYIPGDEMCYNFFHMSLLGRDHIICKQFVVNASLEYLNLVLIVTEYF